MAFSCTIEGRSESEKVNYSHHTECLLLPGAGVVTSATWHDVAVAARGALQSREVARDIAGVESYSGWGGMTGVRMCTAVTVG